MMWPRKLLCVALLAIPTLTLAQDCPGGVCQLQPFELNPLRDVEQIELTLPDVEVSASNVDRFERVARATCRVTVSGVCGSGTVVGRDSANNALVLTNAHVAGTKRGRIVQLERWNLDGSRERGQGKIIASGYGRGLSIDFALLKCNSEFARDVIPIPLADRYPDNSAGVSTYGCPRCEWPSLQVLRLTKSKGQVLRWKPQAIGGRSGSSVIDYTEHGPRVVGLLTWGGGGEGLGQSTPFLLDAMRGRLPTSVEALPPGIYEVATGEQIYPAAEPLNPNRTCNLPDGIAMKPCGIDGRELPACTLHAGDDCDGTLSPVLVSYVTDQAQSTKKVRPRTGKPSTTSSKTDRTRNLTRMRTTIAGC